MAEDVAREMDELGYSTLWMAEHHFQHEGYEVIPNLILLGTYLATQTKQLKFGCAFNVTPMWHPVRIAEDYAMADYLTKGRVVFGVGRGYHTREVESLGAPLLDTQANAALFREQMEIIFKAFNEESWSHRGRFYTIPADVDYRGYRLKDVTIVPRPVNRPVEIWQAIASGKSVPFMVQHGIKGMVTMNGEKVTRQMFTQYQEEAAKIGRNLALGEDLCWGGGLYLANTIEEAIEGVRPYHDERFKWFAPLASFAMPTRRDVPGAPGSADGRSDDRRGTAAEGMACWAAVLCYRTAQRARGKLPWARRSHAALAGGLLCRALKEQLRMFAHDVMPSFRPAAAEVATGGS